MARRRRRRKRRYNFGSSWLRHLKRHQSKFWFVVSAIAAALIIYHALPSAKPPLPGRAPKAVSLPARSTVQPVARTIPAAPIPTVKPVTLPAPPRPAAKPKLVFVIDDIGNQKNYRDLLESLGPSVTYAILPDLSYSSYFAHLGKKLGAEIILHQPLEALDRRSPGPGTIRTDMSDKEALKTLERNLESVPFHVGVNNHMGSRGTSDPHLMRVILSELKRRRLFFLDSYTTLGSTVPDITRELNMPFLRRSVFLDNEDSPEPIRARINDLVRAASTAGFAVGIGHYRENTLRVLNEEIPRLKREGYQIVTLSELLRTEF